MTPAKIAKIMALVDQYAATRNAGYIGSFGTPAEARAAVEAALRDAPQAEPSDIPPYIYGREAGANEKVWTEAEVRMLVRKRDMLSARVLNLMSAAPSAPTAVEPDERDTERMNWIAVHGSFGVDSVTNLPGGNGQKRIAATREAIDAARASKGTP